MSQHRKIKIIKDWYKAQNENYKVFYNNVDQVKYIDYEDYIRDKLSTRVKILLDIDFHDSDIMSIQINTDDSLTMKICSYYTSKPKNITLIFSGIRYIDCFENIEGAQIEGTAIYIEEYGFWYEKKQFYSNKCAFKLIFLVSYPNLKGYPVGEFKICAEDVNIEY